MKALKIYRSHKMDEEVADILTNLARIHIMNLKPYEALKNYGEALDIYIPLIKESTGERLEHLTLELLEAMIFAGEILGQAKETKETVINFQKEAMKLYEVIEEEKKKKVLK